MRFHHFGRDPGVRFLRLPLDLVAERPLGNTVAHNLLPPGRRRDAIDRHIADHYRLRRMAMGFTLRTVPALVDRPGLVRSFLGGDGAILLDGAAGDRARNLLRRLTAAPEAGTAMLRAMTAALDPAEAPLAATAPARVVVQARNLANFFHFTAESLHLLGGLHAAFGTAQVALSAPSADEQPFAAAWCRAAFPEMRDRLALVPDSRRALALDQPVGVLLSARHLLYRFAGPHHEAIERARPADRRWPGYDAAPHPVAVMTMNSHDDTLDVLRGRMLALVPAVPRRWGPLIHVARSAALKRQRVMQGDDALAARLAAMGFQTVRFEEMAPPEQAACVNGARVIVMQHGAGMTNMMFCAPDCHVFEIGTYQTALVRWGDFMPLAQVAGCHYHAVFADMDHEDEADPTYATHGLLAPRLSADAIDSIAGLVAAAMDDQLPGAVGGVLTHSDHLIAGRAYRQADRILDLSLPHLGQHAALWRQKAALCRLIGNRRAEGDNLYRAWERSGADVDRAAFVAVTAEDDPRRAGRD